MAKVAFLLILLVTMGLFLIEEPGDKVVFLDVGQGDSILLQNGTKQVLIDGGPGMSVLEELGREMPWWDKRIEVLVLTHPQRDHMEGFLHILERYEIGLILLPKVVHTSQMQERWLDKIREQGIPYRLAWSGQRITVGEMELEVLSPYDSAAGRAATKSDLNNASVVMRLDYCGENFVSENFWIRHPINTWLNKVEVGCLSFLLSGDAEKPVERMLVMEYGASGDTYVLDVDVYKVGHHGSDSSSTSELIKAMSPAAGVVSVGLDNKFNHPSELVLDRLGDVPIWRTDQHGAISLIRENKHWLLSCQKGCTNSLINF